jgi:hypothetical protein
MSQITTKWLTDGAITPAKLDSSGSFTMKDLHVTRDSTVGGDLHVTRDATVGGDLTVTGNADIVGALIFNDATVDNLNVLNQLNTNLITGTDSTYTATGKLNVWATGGTDSILSLYGEKDAALSSTGPVTVTGTPVNLNSGNDIDASCLVSFNVQAPNINLTALNDSSYLATNNTQIYAGGYLSVIGMNDATLGSAGNIRVSAPFGIIDASANDSSYMATNSMAIGTAVGNVSIQATNDLYLIGINDTTIGAAGNMKLNAPNGTLDASAADIFINSANDSTYSASNNLAIGTTSGNVVVQSYNDLYLIGLNDATVGAAGNMKLNAPLGTIDATSTNIYVNSANDSTYIATNNNQIIALNTLSLIGMVDATLGSTGPVNITGTPINLNSPTGVDVNCYGPFSVQAYDGSDAFQLTGGAGDFVLKQDSGVNQIISQTAPMEIKTLGSQDMTVWSQRDLRLWTPGGNLVADATPNIRFHASNDASYTANNNVAVWSNNLSLIGLNDATLGSVGNITVASANDATLSANNNVAVWSNNLSLIGLNDATLGSVGNVTVASAGNALFSASRFNFSGIPGPYTSNGDATNDGRVAGDLYYDNSDPRHICIAY